MDGMAVCLKMTYKVVLKLTKLSVTLKNLTKNFKPY